VELQRIALEQLAPYDVRVEQRHVTQARRTTNGFEVRTDARTFHGRKLLLATGVRDRDVNVPGVWDLIGTKVFHCPYCDGWEVRDQRLGALAPEEGAADLGLALTTWSANVALFTHGRVALHPDEREELHRNGVEVYQEPLVGVETNGQELAGMRLASGTLVPIDALFVHAGIDQRSPLADQLGCRVEEDQRAYHDAGQRTGVPGVFIAGDAASHVHAVSVASAAGYRAAVNINRELREERSGSMREDLAAAGE
jgi:thioredoxin reductase